MDRDCIDISYVEKVLQSRSEIEGDCLVWLGARSSSGYGQLWVNGKLEYTHRLAWIVHGGSLLPGECVLHTCDNPPCINPIHLRVGDHRDNAKDMADRGRQVFQKDVTRAARGERHGLSKMSKPAVRKMRARYTQGESQRDLADFFGISQASVWAIVNRKTWRHVD